METTVWIPILSGLGGFVIAVAALPLKTLSATTKAAESMSKIYKDTVTRLESDVKYLTEKVDELSIKYEKSEYARCNRVACKSRIPLRNENVKSEN